MLVFLFLFIFSFFFIFRFLALFDTPPIHKEGSSLREPKLSTELDGQILTLSLSRVLYSSDAARTKSTKPLFRVIGSLT